LVTGPRGGRTILHVDKWTRAWFDLMDCERRIVGRPLRVFRGFCHASYPCRVCRVQSHSSALINRHNTAGRIRANVARPGFRPIRMETSFSYLVELQISIPFACQRLCESRIQVCFARTANVRSKGWRIAICQRKPFPRYGQNPVII
jgi:hypothetical protein